MMPSIPDWFRSVIKIKPKNKIEKLSIRNKMRKTIHPNVKPSHQFINRKWQNENSRTSLNRNEFINALKKWIKETPRMMHGQVHFATSKEISEGLAQLNLYVINDNLLHDILMELDIKYKDNPEPDKIKWNLVFLKKKLKTT